MLEVWSGTQLVPQDLAAGRLRDLIDELDDPDLLVRCDALADEMQHVVGTMMIAHRAADLVLGAPL